VRTTPDGRADLDEAEAALAAGDLATAARLLQDAVWLHADSVVQVEADDEQRDQPPRSSSGTRMAPGVGRWAGRGRGGAVRAARRVPAAARAGCARRPTAARWTRPWPWRDLPRCTSWPRASRACPRARRRRPPPRGCWPSAARATPHAPPPTARG
jgi:hypothetical protein